MTITDSVVNINSCNFTTATISEGLLTLNNSSGNSTINSTAVLLSNDNNGSHSISNATAVSAIRSGSGTASFIDGCGFNSTDISAGKMSLISGNFTNRVIGLLHDVCGLLKHCFGDDKSGYCGTCGAACEGMMLKSVYDKNCDDVVDEAYHAVTADCC